MSPRGVAIPDVKEQLFQAAERVLHRDGPDGLTSRAITDEAGVAKGLLYNYFVDLDGFVLELVLDRARAAAAESARLPASAGSGTVGDNLTDAALALLHSHALGLAGVLMSRPSLMTRLHAVATRHPFSPLDDVEEAFGAYLRAEQQLGRIDPKIDADILALILVGTLHHLFVTGRTSGPATGRLVGRIIDALLAA